jgi:hypothetical protein
MDATTTSVIQTMPAPYLVIDDFLPAGIAEHQGSGNSSR